MQKLPQSSIHFSVGDHVFAKQKGYSYWPAIITESSSTNKSPKYSVVFFGNNTTAHVKQTELCLYSENIHRYGQPKTNNFKNIKFNEALKEAEKSYAKTLLNNRNNTCKNELADQSYQLVNNPQLEMQKQTYNSVVSKTRPLAEEMYEAELFSQPEETEHQVRVKEITTYHAHFHRSRLNNSLAELENSLTHESVLSEDDELTMAAKVGSALLEENELLRAQNNELLAKVLTLEAVEEDSKKEEDKYLLTIETLNQKLGDIDRQLIKKHMHLEMQRIFEEHDKKQNDMINNYKKKNSDLEKLVKTLQGKSHTDNVDNHKETWRTEPPEVSLSLGNTKSALHNSMPTPDFLNELETLKRKHDILEQKLMTLEEEIKKKDPIVQHDESIKPLKILGKNARNNTNLRREKKKQNVFSVSMQVSKSGTRYNLPQLYKDKQHVDSKEDNTGIENLPANIITPTHRHMPTQVSLDTLTRSKILSNSSPTKSDQTNNKITVVAQVHRPNTNPPLRVKEDKVLTDDRELADKPDNCLSQYSVSLQVAKAQEEITASEASPTEEMDKQDIKQSRMKLSQGPPLNARQKAKQESYDDFYDRNITFYKRLMNNYSGGSSLEDSLTDQSMDSDSDTHAHFLGPPVTTQNPT